MTSEKGQTEVVKIQKEMIKIDDFRKGSKWDRENSKGNDLELATSEKGQTEVVKIQKELI